MPRAVASSAATAIARARSVETVLRGVGGESPAWCVLPRRPLVGRVTAEGLWGPRRWASLGLAIVVGALRSQLDFYPRYVHRERVVTYGQRVAVGDMLVGLSFDCVRVWVPASAFPERPRVSAGPPGLPRPRCAVGG